MPQTPEKDIQRLVAELTGKRLPDTEVPKFSEAVDPIHELAPDLARLQQEAMARKQFKEFSFTVDADKKTSPSSENLPRSGEDIREQLHQLDEKIESLGRKSLKNEIINELRVSNERILQQVFQNKEDLRKEISGYFTNRNTGRDSFIKWLGVLNLLLSGLIIGYLLFQKTATPVVVPQYIPAQVAAPATAPPLASPVQPNEQRAETSPIAPAGSQIQSVRPQRNSRVKPVSVQEAPRIHSASTHATLSPAQPAPAEKREVTPVVRQTENTEPVYFGDDQP